MRRKLGRFNESHRYRGGRKKPEGYTYYDIEEDPTEILSGMGWEVRIATEYDDDFDKYKVIVRLIDFEKDVHVDVWHFASNIKEADDIIREVEKELSRAGSLEGVFNILMDDLHFDDYEVL